jgi:hypothetical protein
LNLTFPNYFYDLIFELVISFSTWSIDRFEKSVHSFRLIAKIRVTYAVGTAEKEYLIMFPKGRTVGDFLELITEKQKDSDLCVVFLDGAEIPNDDLFDDWFDPDAVFRVSNSPEFSPPIPRISVPFPTVSPPIRQNSVESSTPILPKLRVPYTVGASKRTWLVMFPKGRTVRNFIELIQVQRHNSDLVAVSLDSRKLNNDDDFDDYFHPDRVFHIEYLPTDSHLVQQNSVERSIPRMPEVRVTYAIGASEKTYLVMFPKGREVGDFVELIKDERRSRNLCAVSVDGTKLDNDDLFDDWYHGGAVFRVIS